MAAVVAKIHKKKQAILSLEKYLEKDVVVLCEGGRSYRGKLRGFDNNINLLLDEAKETREGVRKKDGASGPPTTRDSGVTVIRGQFVLAVTADIQPIANPYETQ